MTRTFNIYIQAYRPVGPEKLPIDWSGFYKDMRQKTPKMCITREFKITVIETVLFVVVFWGPDLQKHSPTREKLRSGSSPARRILRKSEFSMHMINCICT